MRHSHYPQAQGQEIRIKSPHLLRIRSNHAADNQRLHLYKPNLGASNGQKYFAFHPNAHKDDKVKVYQPSVPLQNLMLTKKAASNWTQFDQIKELTTLESGENQQRYRKIKHDKIKELTRNKNSQMNTITSQGNNDCIKEKKKNNHKQSKAQDMDSAKPKQYHSIRNKANETSTNKDTHNTNLMTRSRSVYSKLSKRSLDLSQSSQLKRCNSNKKDALRILDETIKGLTKLKTIILDDEDEDEEEDKGHCQYQDDDDDDYPEKENEPDIDLVHKAKANSKLRKKKLHLHLQNGIQHINELINNSMTRESLSRIKRKSNKHHTVTDPDNKANYHKRTITELPEVKKQKSFIDIEKEYPNHSPNYKANNTKNAFLIGAHRHMKAKRKLNNNEIENFDQEFLMKIFNTNKKTKANNTHYNPNINTNSNITNAKLNKSSLTTTKKKQRYESDNDTLANFEFSD